MRTTRELQVTVVSDRRRILASMLEEKIEDTSVEEQPDVPLPATLTFVLIIGATFFVLWFGVFLLLKERW